MYTVSVLKSMAIKRTPVVLSKEDKIKVINQNKDWQVLKVWTLTIYLPLLFYLCTVYTDWTKIIDTPG